MLLLLQIKSNLYPRISMYYIDKNLRISTPALITLLEANNFKIIKDETAVTIVDNIRLSEASCTLNDAHEALTQMSAIYNKYSVVPETLLKLKETNNMFVDIEKEYREVREKLIYFYCIQNCAKRLGRIKKIIEKTITICTDTNHAPEDSNTPT